MKITNVETISFMAKSRAYPTRWGYGTTGDEHEQIQRILKIETDEGAEGFFTGGLLRFLT